MVHSLMRLWDLSVPFDMASINEGISSSEPRIFILVGKDKLDTDSIRVIGDNVIARPIKTLSLGMELPCTNSESATVIGFSHIQELVLAAFRDTQKIASISANKNRGGMLSITSSAANKPALGVSSTDCTLSDFEAAEKRLTRILAQPKVPFIDEFFSERSRRRAIFFYFLVCLLLLFSYCVSLFVLFIIYLISRVHQF